MQATEAAPNKDLAGKAATVARWTGKALWFVLRIFCVLLLLAVELLRRFSGSSSQNNSEPDLAGHDPMRSTEFNWGRRYRGDQ